MTREQAMREAAMKAPMETFGGHTMPVITGPSYATAGADAERARVVEWLRWSDNFKGLGHEGGRLLSWISDAIERGEHWRGE